MIIQDSLSSTRFDSLLTKSKKVSALFSQLSHPVRLQVLCCLVSGEKTVGELAQFCQLSQPNMSQFLARMKKGGLVNSRRESQMMYYRLGDEKLLALLSSVKKIFC